MTKVDEALEKELVKMVELDMVAVVLWLYYSRKSLCGMELRCSRPSGRRHSKCPQSNVQIINYARITIDRLANNVERAKATE